MTGTNKNGNSNAEAEYWCNSIEISMERDLQLQGAGDAVTPANSTIANQMASEYYGFYCASSLAADTKVDVDPETTYQWTLEIVDQYGYTYTTYTDTYVDGISSAPQCIPGGNANNDYTSCQEGMYLPGYPSTNESDSTVGATPSVTRARRGLRARSL